MVANSPIERLLVDAVLEPGWAGNDPVESGWAGNGPAEPGGPLHLRPVETLEAAVRTLRSTPGDTVLLTDAGTADYMVREVR